MSELEWELIFLIGAGVSLVVCIWAYVGTFFDILKDKIDSEMEECAQQDVDCRGKKGEDDAKVY